MWSWRKAGLVVLGAVALGTSSAALAIHHVGTKGALRNGAWVTSLSAGSADASMYLRAAVAVGALFALERRETIYLTAFVDDEGAPLRTACDYLLVGHDLPARWWSLTVYGDDHFLVPNPQDRYSYNRNNLAQESDGGYQIQLASDRREGNWLPTGSAGGFSVTLRLYNPAPELVQALAAAELPRIRRGRCR